MPHHRKNYNVMKIIHMEQGKLENEKRNIDLFLEHCIIRENPMFIISTNMTNSFWGVVFSLLGIKGI